MERVVRVAGRCQGAWPHDGVDFIGKRVAVIGTGATAVQAIPEIAQQAAHVHVPPAGVP